ncbi:MAG: hypothetical protein ACI9PU_000617, partial [Ascidiaceihabitans sp.]
LGLRHIHATRLIGVYTDFENDINSV